MNLSNYQSMLGRIKPQYQKKIEALLRDINQETWEEAHGIILDGHGTVWQYVCYVDPSYPRSKGGRDWQLPEPERLRLALELAHDNAVKGLWLVCGSIKPLPEYMK